MGITEIYSAGAAVHKIDSTGNQVWTYTGHSGTVYSVDVVGGNVYSGSGDYEVHKIDSAGNNVWIYTGYTNIVRAVAVDASGNVYAGGDDNQVHKIDPAGMPVWTYTMPGFVGGVAVDASGNVYATSSDDTVHKIDSAGNNVWIYTGHSSVPFHVTVDNSGNIYSGDFNGEVHKIDSAGNNVWIYTGYSSPVAGIAVDSAGVVYAGDVNGEVHKIDSAGNNVWIYTGHSSQVNSVDVDVDGNVYSASSDNTVHKIDPNGNNVWIYTGHASAVQGVSVSSREPITVPAAAISVTTLPVHKIPVSIPAGRLTVRPRSVRKIPYILAIQSGLVSMQPLNPAAQGRKQTPAATITVNGRDPTETASSSIPAAVLSTIALVPRQYWTPDPTRTQVLYIFSLGGQIIPISSCQMRRRNGKPTYMSVVIPDYDTWVDTITAQSGGEMILYKGYRFSDGTVQTGEIARVNYETPRFDKGSRERSISLTGHATVSNTAPATVTIQGASYRTIGNDGRRRFRAAVDLWLQPGDTAVIEGESMVVGFISYIIDVKQEVMEITEE